MLYIVGRTEKRDQSSSVDSSPIAVKLSISPAFDAYLYTQIRWERFSLSSCALAHWVTARWWRCHLGWCLLLTLQL